MPFISSSNNGSILSIIAKIYILIIFYYFKIIL